MAGDGWWVVDSCLLAVSAWWQLRHPQTATVKHLRALVKKAEALKPADLSSEELTQNEKLELVQMQFLDVPGLIEMFQWHCNYHNLRVTDISSHPWKVDTMVMQYWTRGSLKVTVILGSQWFRSRRQTTVETLPLLFFIVPQPRDPKRKACLNSSSRSSLDPQNCVDHPTAAAEELHKHHNHCDTGHGQSCLYHIYILPKANSFKSILQLPSQPFCKVERWLLG